MSMIAGTWRRPQRDIRIRSGFRVEGAKNIPLSKPFTNSVPMSFSIYCLILHYLTK